MKFVALNNFEKNINYIIFICWTSLWLSLSFNPENLLNLNYEVKQCFFYNFDSKCIINMTRGIMPLLCFPIIILILIKDLKKEHIFDKSNNIFLFLVLFFLIQFIGLFYTNNDILNSYFLINALNVVFISFLIKIRFPENLRNSILIFSLVILFGVLIFYGSTYFIKYFSGSGNFYGVWGNIERDYQIYAPRPTGLGRTALVILIFSSFFSCMNHNYKKICLILNTICCIFIFLLSSRAIIFLFFVFLLSYFIFNRIIKFKDIFYNLLKFLIIPILLVYMLSIVKTIFFESDKTYLKNSYVGMIYKKIYNKELNYEENYFLSLFGSKASRSLPKFRTNELGKFSSGRTEDWMSIIDNNKNILFGYGAMGDRFLINQSASSIILYSYASSGLLGLSLIVIIILLILKIIIKSSIFLRKNSIKVSCALTLFTLLGRSVLETSYGVFGIDLMLLGICIAVLISNDRNKTNESN